MTLHKKIICTASLSAGQHNLLQHSPTHTSSNKNSLFSQCIQRFIPIQMLLEIAPEIASSWPKVWHCPFCGLARNQFA